MTDLLIPHALAQGLVNYLAQRPYAEVAGFVVSMQQQLRRMPETDNESAPAAAS